jgi:hypothetical protein
VTVRFVIDESSWMNATEHTDAVPEAVDALLERLDVARERQEHVAKHPYIYEVEIGGGRQLYSVLFDPECPLPLEHDIVALLQLALDRSGTLDDSGLSSYDVIIAGSPRFAPAVAWAHAQHGQGRGVAVLPLPLDHSPQGECEVVVDGVAHRLHFVTTEQEHRAFFRDVIQVEDADEEGLRALAASAFPTLGWADEVWRELGDFSKPYRDLRDVLVVHLGVLDDHGAKLFATLQRTSPAEIGPRLDALGARASDENGRTKQYKEAEKDRTRRYQGRDHVFWWHTKLERFENRIYFLHIPGDPPPHGRIVIGIFNKHCKLLD